VNDGYPRGEQKLNFIASAQPTGIRRPYDGGMTPSQLVLASVGLGIVTGALLAWAILGARAAGRRRSVELNPELPAAVVEVLHPLDSFAVILDASLSLVYANPAARDNPHVNGNELREPEFLRRARRVMSSGITDTREPDPQDAGSTVRVRIVRIDRRFLVVFADDLGEEQRVNAMRRDFIANVSHELKTPIAAISLLSEAVYEGADEPGIVRDFAKKLKKEARRLGNLARDVIQLSEAQSSLKPEDLEPVSLLNVLRSEVEAHRDLAAQQGVELVLTEGTDDQFDGEIPRSGLRGELEYDDPITMGRPGAIGTVFANLISNAIRHSNEGGRVGVGIQSSGKQCLVTITDQGEGIAPEHLPRIFERFYRVDTARSREGGGTGLGLSIARHTMRAHGGDIDVWSQPGVGSSFTVSFPVFDDAAGAASGGRKRKLKNQKKKKKKKAGQKAARTEKPKTAAVSREKSS